MAKSVPIEKKAAAEIGVEKLSVWYHLPLALYGNVDDLFSMGAIKGDICPPAFSRCGWGIVNETDGQSSSAAGYQQHNYFHEFVSKALWQKNSDFTTFIKTDLPYKFTAEHSFKEDSEKDPIKTFIRGRVVGSELRIVRPAKSKIEGVVKGLAILIVAVEYDGISGDNKTFGALTLADAQDTLEWARRIFPRWWKEGFPGDCLTAVHIGEKSHWASPSEADFQSNSQRNDQRTPVAPWVAKLIAPLTLAGTKNAPTLSAANAEHFGDDRSYMTSAICLKAEKDQAFSVMASIHDGDIFRLAEADRRAHGTPPDAYQRPFLEELRGKYFYNRHAYDPDTATGNATQYLISQHHLCTLGAGEYFEKEIGPHVETYYRHMQFLCLFEYYRLIQFSMRLSNLVGNETLSPSQFRQALIRIRKDFLRHTHVHHFSNVSSQLQPREMYEKLYQNMGIADMFAEVEGEIKAAADFVMLEEAREKAEAADRLQDLLGFGVPLTLVVGVAGMNILVGDQIQSIFPPSSLVEGATMPIRHQLFQISLIAFSVFGLWGVASISMLQTKEIIDEDLSLTRRVHRIIGRFGMMNAFVFVMSLVVMLCAYLDIW